MYRDIINEISNLIEIDDEKKLQLLEIIHNYTVEVANNTISEMKTILNIK